MSNSAGIGSMDDIFDMLEKLRKRGIPFFLAIGIPGSNATRAFLGLGSLNMDDMEFVRRSFISALDMTLDKVLKKQKEG